MSYAEDGSAVEVVILDARARGALPVLTLPKAAFHLSLRDFSTMHCLSVPNNIEKI
jgi:hypothetical protein